MLKRYVMNRITGLFVLTCVCLLFVVTFSPMRAQTTFTTHILCTDGLASDSLSLGIGVSPLATYGIDSTLLGEKEQPPFPPVGVFYAVLVDPRGNRATGQGLLLDLRPLFWDAQYDTFEIDYQRDSSAVANHQQMTFSWPSKLDSIGSGMRWKMIDPVTYGSLINVDMNAQTSYAIPLSYNVGQIWIIKSDPVKFRSFCYTTIANDKDQFGKGGKANVGKTAIHDKFTATKTQMWSAHVDSVVLAFSGPVYDSTLVYSPFTSIKDNKNDHKGFSLSGAAVDSLGTFNIHGIGQKGAILKLTIAAFYHGAAVPKKGKNSLKCDSIVVNTLQFPEPDVTNLLTYIMANATFPTTEGLIIGDPSFHGYQGGVKPKDSTYYVYHKKLADVQKSLVKWTQNVSTIHTEPGTPHVFYHDMLIGGKIMKAKVEGLAPTTSSNPLFAEALTLKLNLLFSTVDFAGNNLNHVLMVDPASKFVGMNLAAISAFADTFITNPANVKNPALSSVGITDLYNDLHRINCAFESSLDTVSWSNAKPLLTAAVCISDVPYLKRDIANPSRTVPIQQANAAVPVEYTLFQNYPNPFNPTTTIEFKLPVTSYVTVVVFNMLGQEVVKLADHQQFAEGTSHVQFDAARYASGVYFYRILVNDLANGAMKFQEVRKMMLLK